MSPPPFVVAVLAAWMATDAHAACTGPVVDTLTCTSVVSGQLDPGPWDGSLPAPLSCPDDFGDLENDLGATCSPSLLIGRCIDWSCAGAGRYACGVPYANEAQDGPEDVYAFSCQQDGDVTVALTGMDCDLDLYVLSDSCDPTDCLEGSTTSNFSSDSVTFSCTEGDTYYIVVEGYGFTWPAWYAYESLGSGLGYCYPESPGAFGNYTLSFEFGDPATSGCAEDCVNGVDDDGDTLVDCDDPDCAAHPACLAFEICDNGIDDDSDTLVDCDDPDCWDEAYCCDDDLDGFIDIACGGTDCDDRDPHLDDGDGDTWPDECDNCPDDADVTQADGDGDGFGDVCDVCAGDDDLVDGDEDTVPDGCDNCPADANAKQIDGDGDGTGDVCDPCPGDAYEVDDDGDGYLVCDDCDDTDPTLEPADRDGDGQSTCDGDCRDEDAAVFVGSTEVADGVDQDCDGIVDEGTDAYDDDGDGWAENGGDCNDADPAVHPGVVEICNSIDDDCDGTVDEDTDCRDDDGDGYSEDTGDCNDGDPAVNPGATEVPDNDIDDDCDGEVDVPAIDNDGDGYTEEAGDCDDANAAVYPGASEEPDGFDNDCDSLVDEGTTTTDDDGDGYTEVNGDCDDTNASIHPNATDTDNGIDDDCDDIIDEGSPGVDDDGDGLSELEGDCNDGDASVRPGAEEVLGNGIDDDCDGATDEPIDEDGDGWTVEAGDCDDFDGWANPSVEEQCDGVDNNCDGVIDETCSDYEPPDTGAVIPSCDGCASGGSPAALWWLVLPLAALRRRTP